MSRAPGTTPSPGFGPGSGGPPGPGSDLGGGSGTRGVSRVRDDRLRQGGLFIPLVFAFAARLEGLPPQEFLREPTKVVNGLRSIFAYLGADGVTCWCDDTALAAALGCVLDWSEYPPRVAAAGTAAADPGDLAAREPAALAADVIRRMGGLMPDTVLVASMPGPAALASQVGGDPAEFPASPDALRAAAKACIAYAKALCAAGLDILLVREPAIPAPGVDLSTGDVVRLYSGIWNTARHYGAAALLAPTNYDAAALAALAAAVDGVIVPAAEDGATALAQFKRVGIALPTGLFELPCADIEAYLTEHAMDQAVRGGALLVTSAAEIPLNVDREALIAGVGAIRDRVKEARSRG